jgi:hypothetical protein
MTAIAGFNCVDGIVLAADTEESYGESGDKAYANKLFPVERKHANLCVAGAGTGYLIDYAKEKIISALEDTKNNAEFEIRLSEVLNALYADDGEFRKYPVASPAYLAIQLLVGVQFRKESDPSKWEESTLFECESNLVTQVPLGRGRILGAGELLKETASQFTGWGLSAALAEWTSFYIIYEAKRRYGGIGGKTHTCTIWADGKKMVYPMGKDARDKEAVLDDGLPRITQLLMLSLDPAVSDSRSKDLFNAVRIWVANARKELKKISMGRHKKKTDSIAISSREMESFIRKLRSATPSISQKSEPEQ